ncbi:MAG: ABC transporter ATP-binding protein [Chloroflexi bacterium]|nr:ABC transporter ATP-binding protein [Chloroflexota bacterium]
MALLDISNVESGYGDVQILWGVSLKLEEGRLTTLVGANGSGKTTLMRAVMGLLPVPRGVVAYAGRNVTRVSPHAKADMGLVMIPEGRQLFTDLTVRENLEMGATPRHARGEMNKNLERVFDLFPRLKERVNQVAGTLSGGEQQMLAIARGLMAKPRVLMFDEPSLGLSPLLTLNLFQVIRALKQTGITMLLVEQNVQMALAVSDYAYVMAHGKIEIEGAAKQVREMESVRKAYLGV